MKPWESTQYAVQDFLFDWARGGTLPEHDVYLYSPTLSGIAVQSDYEDPDNEDGRSASVYALFSVDPRGLIRELSEHFFEEYVEPTQSGGEGTTVIRSHQFPIVDD
jgi:hypothetical protein